MSAATRLAGFAAVLVLVFAGAAVAGGAVDVDRSAPPPRRATARGMEMTADPSAASPSASTA